MKRILIAVMMMVSINLMAQENKGFQLSLVSPLGTNGLNTWDVSNTVSLNILGGHSAGTKAFELGGLYNINKSFTTGLQIAGITNITLGEVKGLQIGGITNVSKDVKGMQIAGISNVSKDVKGMQIAGISNVSKDVKGMQIAGISNVSKDVKGMQLAGILNVAKHVSGVQVGLINYAESSDGVSIGLINIVKNGGKQEFEVAFSEALNTSVSFRLGNDAFYTIFSGGINYLYEDKPDFAAGIGFGTQINWKKGWANQIEAVGYALTEDGKFHDGINMLTQLRFTFSKEFFPRLKIFAGPVLNMTISDYVNPETGQIGSTLSPWSMWKSTNEKTSLNSWVGFTLGLRF